MCVPRQSTPSRIKRERDERPVCTFVSSGASELSSSLMQLNFLDAPAALYRGRSCDGIRTAECSSTAQIKRGAVTSPTIYPDGH